MINTVSTARTIGARVMGCVSLSYLPVLIIHVVTCTAIDQFVYLYERLWTLTFSLFKQSTGPPEPREGGDMISMKNQ